MDCLTQQLFVELQSYLEPMMRNYKRGTCSRFYQLKGPHLMTFCQTSVLGRTLLPYYNPSDKDFECQVGIRIGSRRIGRSATPVTRKTVVELELFL